MRRIAIPILVALLGATACGPPTPKPKPNGPVEQNDQPATPFDKGVRAIEAEAWQEALTNFDAALAKDPGNAEATYYRGVALEKLGKLDEAVAAYEKALKLDAKLAAVRINLAAIYLEAKPPKAKEAIEVLKPVAADTKDSMVHENLAYAYIVSGNAEKAEEHYKKALTIDDHPRIHYALADLLFEAGKKEESAAHYQKAWPGFTGDLDNLVRIAHRLGKTRSYEDCVKAFTAAIELKDNEPGFHLHRGLCRHGLKQLEEERADYESALQLDETFAPAWYYLGMSSKKSDPKKAKEAFQNAVKHGGTTPVAKRAKQQLAKMK
jgi:tetratricopeptide (TPR) repeat protein